MKDIDLLKHPYYWMGQPERASFMRVILEKSPDVHFVENPLLPAIDYKCEKLPASIKIYPQKMNTGNHTKNKNGHWVRFSIYKDIQKIIIDEACAAGTKSRREEYSTVIK